jgi:hypothetical protein
MKPKHQAGYTALHAELCERTLVTLLRGLGPWKAGIYLTGGLVPRYLIPRQPDNEQHQAVARGGENTWTVWPLTVVVKRRREQNARSDFQSKAES